MHLPGRSIAKGVDACRIGMSRPLPHAMRRTTTVLPCFRGAPRYSTRACGNTGRNSRITIYSLSSAPNTTMLTAVSLRWCRQTRDFSSTSQTERPKADDYIQELQDLYEIVKDELEIAAESTAAATIYAVSDRISLREAFDDLDHAYSAYTGTTPHPSRLERPANARLAGKEDGAKVFGEGGEGDGERPNGSSMNFNPAEVPDEVREEIKKRIGQRIRELRNAVEQLEENVTQ
ncbi:3-oxoacyl-(Acyl-carrier-protein) reductase [Histoplasma ohiense]|nr:3-oxoacyl-(Acyl-carrier-protein) reductase [Histoplasma ohiense (nom. inval.)]